MASSAIACSSTRASSAPAARTAATSTKGGLGIAELRSNAGASHPANETGRADERPETPLNRNVTPGEKRKPSERHSIS